MTMLPDKDVKCHRTFARAEGPIDCRTLVCEHGCRLWKHVVLEGEPGASPVKPVDHYDCADSLVDLYLRDMLRRQLQTTATVDKLSKTVAEANDQQMVGAMARLNQQIEERRQLASGAAPAPLLIEQD